MSSKGRVVFNTHHMSTRARKVIARALQNQAQEVAEGALNVEVMRRRARLLNSRIAKAEDIASVHLFNSGYERIEVEALRQVTGWRAREVERMLSSVRGS